MTPLLQAACEAHPVVVLTGARQVGKSTLLRRAEPFSGWRYHTMDDFDTLRQVRENPASLWAGAHEVVLDEVQKAPELLPAIKRAVDEQPGRYRFLLSGSANLLLTPAPTGRYGVGKSARAWPAARSTWCSIR